MGHGEGHGEAVGTTEIYGFDAPFPTQKCIFLTRQKRCIVHIQPEKGGAKASIPSIPMFPNSFHPETLHPETLLAHTFHPYTFHPDFTQKLLLLITHTFHTNTFHPETLHP